jgi:hypothetical protein
MTTLITNPRSTLERMIETNICEGRCNRCARFNIPEKISRFNHGFGVLTTLKESYIFQKKNLFHQALDNFMRENELAVVMHSSKNTFFTKDVLTLRKQDNSTTSDRQG